MVKDICYCDNCVFIDVNQNIPDWNEYLMKKLVGAYTLPVDFYLKVKHFNKDDITILPLTKFLISFFNLLISISLTEKFSKKETAGN